MYDFILLFIFWKNYIYSKKIKNIFVTHTVYHHAIPLRIAVSLGIKVFQVNLKFAYQINKNNLYAYTEFKNYKKIFNKKFNSKKNKLFAKKKLESKLKGNLIEVDYVAKSSYGSIDKNNSVLNKNNKVKILIAPHCLFDNPHSFGLHIFEDYIEWLQELANLSEELNYEWYIKNHPTVNPINFKFARNLSKKYKNIFYIDPNVNHNQIIQEGIDCCLTMYGNITIEYAYFKIPVIVASKNQPYCNYNFYTYPKTKKNYFNLLSNLKKIKKKIIIDEVYQAYYMKYIYGLKNWFFKKKIGLPEEFKNRSLDTPKIISYFSKGFSRKNLDEKIKEFMISKNYRMGF